MLFLLELIWNVECFTGILDLMFLNISHAILHKLYIDPAVDKRRSSCSLPPSHNAFLIITIGPETHFFSQIISALLHLYIHTCRNKNHSDFNDIYLGDTCYFLLQKEKSLQRITDIPCFWKQKRISWSFCRRNISLKTEPSKPLSHYQGALQRIDPQYSEGMSSRSTSVWLSLLPLLQSPPAPCGLSSV